MDKAIRIIDTFAGAGGMTLGFVRSSGGRFQPVWANDFNDCAVATYNTNFGNHCIGGPIEELLEDPGVTIPQGDIVIGGPPCQGFSLLNRDRDGDERRQLWQQFFEVVTRSNASAFVMENVPQLLTSLEYEEIVQAAEKLGFKVFSDKLCAADYGVPQIRNRALIVGCKFADPKDYFPPLRTHYNSRNGSYDPKLYVENPQPWRTVREVIGDLPTPEGTNIRDVPPPLDLHFGRMPTPKSIARYKAIPEEGMNRFDLQRNAPELMPLCWIKKKSGGTDLFGRLWWDRQAYTIRTEFYKPEKGRSLHPEQHRPITHREAARFQSFPDDFVFCGKKIEIAKQIGNAVPPMLAAAIAGSMYRMFSDAR